MTQPGIESRSPGPLANTLPTGPLGQIDLLKDYFYSIGLCAKNLLRNTYTKNVNMNAQWMQLPNL